MAGKLRYWKEKDGRFFARVAVPKRLQPYLDRPRGELIEALGADRRVALRIHPAAVARLQSEIAAAEQKVNAGTARQFEHQPARTPITTADFGRAVWHRYEEALEEDETKRERYPSSSEIAAEHDLLLKKVQSGQVATNALALFDASFDYLVLKEARALDQYGREIRLLALKRELAVGDTHQVEHEVDEFLKRHALVAEPDSAERSVLAKQMMRGEIEALNRSIERDKGDYTGKPSDPIVKPPAILRMEDPVKISELWADYVKSRVQAGFLKDGGKRQGPVIKSLRTFVKHDDARRITKKDIIAWRDDLLSVKVLAAKTVSDIYLSTVRSLFGWAHENERLPENVAEKVRQPKPRKVLGREKGYTDTEALAVLRATRSHIPNPNQFGYVKETAHMTSAKRWAPLLAAFSGARISEVTQLRKEDIRKEGERWIARITPDAGSVKAGGYRDVPLHIQVVEQGFIDFVVASSSGPLFHGSTDPANFATAAQSISDELAKWLRGLGLVPKGVRPNYGWRDRLKTQALELGLTMRVIDAMQGHSGRTAGENYGDVTIIAKARVIDGLPHYGL